MYLSMKGSSSRNRVFRTKYEREDHKSINVKEKDTRVDLIGLKNKLEKAVESFEWYCRSLQILEPLNFQELLPGFIILQCSK